MGRSCQAFKEANFESFWASYLQWSVRLAVDAGSDGVAAVDDEFGDGAVEEQMKVRGRQMALRGFQNLHR